MLAKCANPACSNHFLYLHQGKLFRLDREEIVAADPDFREHGPQLEFFWLCEDCSGKMTLAFDKELGVTVLPRDRARTAAAA